MVRRLDGLLDEPRPGAPRKVDDAQIERLIATTLNQTPRDATHWSTRSLAKKLGLSQSTVSRVWRTFGPQPHRSESFKLRIGSEHRTGAVLRFALAKRARHQGEP